jgi:hypothetical protein
VAEGDVVESRGRGVLQLGDGTRIAFGPLSRFTVAALFADATGTREVLLRLDYGRLRVRLGPASQARVRIDTPSGSGSLVDRADATFEVGRDNSVRLRVHGGRTDFGNDKGRAAIRAGERLTLYSPVDNLDRINDFNTYDEDGFDRWVAQVTALRRTESAGRVPPEIRYYADDLDNHGKWVYVDDCAAWCWSPSGVATDWRPYSDGRWGAYAGGMTWISDEPWGYVTYHHGRWGWGASFGWYWIPGVSYAPAWVAWNSSDAYFGWAPLGYRNQPCAWGYGAWGGGFCWNILGVGMIGRRDYRGAYQYDPRIIGQFNRPQAGGTPWFRSRMIVSRAEFHDPAQFRRVAEHRELARERSQSYERAAQAATGRTLLRRDGPPAAGGPRAFEAGLARSQARPILRESARNPGWTQDRAPGGRMEGRPRVENRPGEVARPDAGRPGGARPEPGRIETGRSAPGWERPRREEARPEPQRERPRSEDRRAEPQRPAMREEPRAPREAPRMESRPAAPARSESRPAPAPARPEPRPSREGGHEHR